MFNVGGLLRGIIDAHQPEALRQCEPHPSIPNCIEARACCLSAMRLESSREQPRRISANSSPPIRQTTSCAHQSLSEQRTDRTQQRIAGGMAAGIVLHS